MKKLVFILLIALFLTTIVVIPNAVGSPPVEALAESRPYDGTPDLEDVTVSWAEPDTGNAWTVIVYNWGTGGFYYLNFECVLTGTTCNIWVGLSPKVWTGGYKDERVVNGPGIEDDVFYFAYPWSYNAHIVSYRYLDGYRDYVNGTQLQAVADEFDSKIGQTCVDFFGDYDHSRIGPLGDGKIQILVFNIRDEFFYGSFGLGFVMGYFWSFVSDLNNANIIHIDTWQWYRRQGPNPDGGVGCPYIAVPYSGSTLLPYQYEGTIAHEFQHLIHNDNDGDEYSWVNEGCSTLAEFICGYGHTTNLFDYIAYFWSTSLVIWQNNLENYGVVYLWTLYMYEHYGGQPLIWDIVHEQANGIEGWNIVLQEHGITKSFDEIFQDWAIANYLDDTSFAGGIYGYYNLDLPCAASGWWDIPYSMSYWDSAYPEYFDFMVIKLHGNYEAGWAYPYGSLLPYTVNYVKFDALGAHSLEVRFYGDPVAGVVPRSGIYEWHSDGTAWSWFRLNQTFGIPATGATLKFWSYYDIEENWDYGYVEVHDLDTGQWYTLPGLGTISTIPNPQDNPNCPANVEPTAYLAAGRWNAFTGSSGGWYQETMDLSAFAGHNIELYFTYWTDPYTLGLGWYVDNIEIPEIGFFDDVESGQGSWVVNAGWYITAGVVASDNDHSVNFIQHVEITHPKLGYEDYTEITPMVLDDETETGAVLFPMINTKFVHRDSPVMVIAVQPGFEHTFASSYVFFYQKEPMPYIS